jgi:hypothetical protein
MDTDAEVVRYFHESWSHRSMDLMSQMDIKIIVDNKSNSSKTSFNNNLSALTIFDNATNYK